MDIDKNGHQPNISRTPLDELTLSDEFYLSAKQTVSAIWGTLGSVGQSTVASIARRVIFDDKISPLVNAQCVIKDLEKAGVAADDIAVVRQITINSFREAASRVDTSRPNNC